MVNKFEEINNLVNHTLSLYELSNEAKNSNNQELGGEIYEELLTVLIPKAESLIALNDEYQALSHFALGLILRVLNIYENAILEFQKSLTIEPNMFNSLLEITLCLGQTGKHILAEEYARKAIAIDSESSAAWGNLATTLIQNNIRKEGFDAICKAVKLDPEDSKNRYILTNFHRYFD